MIIMDAEQQHSDITVQFAKSFNEIDVSFSKLEELIKTTCRQFELFEAIVSVAIVDDNDITEVNKQFLNRSKITDCISFDLSDHNPDSPKVFDLVVNGEMAQRLAQLRSISAEAELALYVIHALLHNLGFDDATQEQAKKMHNTEDKILQQQGFGLVYNKRINAQQ